MTSISSATGSLPSLTSYYAKLAGASTDESTDATATDAGMTASEAETLMGMTGTGTDGGTAASSTILSGSGALASLLGSSFADTNSLLSQIGALATSGSSTASGTDAATQQQKIASLLASVSQTEQQDFLSILL